MNKKVSLLTALIFLLVNIFAASAFAQDDISPDLPPKPTEGIESNDPDFGTGFYINPSEQLVGSKTQAATSTDAVIVYGKCSIRKVSSGYVAGYAQTVASQLVDEVGFTMYFQMWNGDYWQNVSSATDYTYNNISYDNQFFRYVTKQRYYRVHIVHYIKDNGVRKTSTCTSSYIYVD